MLDFVLIFFKEKLAGIAKETPYFSNGSKILR